MDTDTAVRRLSALAHDARLSVFRLLVVAGSEGIAAGDIARELSVPPNTLSAQLLILANAQLVRAKREGRSIIYSAQFDNMRSLLQFLVEDCCSRSPEICAPLVADKRTPSRTAAPKTRKRAGGRRG